MTEKLLRVDAAAEQLGMSTKWLWKKIGAREVSVVRLGRSVRVPQSALDELIEAGTTPAIGEVANSHPRRRTSRHRRLGPVPIDEARDGTG
jgi:excisionase family DNA binding protein